MLAEPSNHGIDQEKVRKCASGINNTDFVWSLGGEPIDMTFISGFAGATMTDDGYIKPQMAWGVSEKQQQQKEVTRMRTFKPPVKKNKSD